MRKEVISLYCISSERSETKRPQGVSERVSI